MTARAHHGFASLTALLAGGTVIAAVLSCAVASQVYLIYPLSYSKWREAQLGSLALGVITVALCAGWLLRVVSLLKKSEPPTWRMSALLFSGALPAVSIGAAILIESVHSAYHDGPNAWEHPWGGAVACVAIAWASAPAAWAVALRKRHRSFARSVAGGYLAAFLGGGAILLCLVSQIRFHI